MSRRHRSKRGAVIGLRQSFATRTSQRDVGIRNLEIHRIANRPVHGVVVVVVLAITCIQSRRVVTHGRALSSLVAGVVELVRHKARAGTRSGHRTDVRLLGGSINSAHAATVHRDVQRAFADGYLTVHHRKGHHFEVGVRVLEESRHEVHLRGAGIRTGGRHVGNITGKVDVAVTVVGRSSIDGVTRHGVRLSVVEHHIRIRVTRDCHRSVDLVDCQPAVRHMENHILELLRIIVAKHICGKTHRIDTGSGFRH